MENSTTVITRYLEDAIAAEKSFETQLREFAAEGHNPAVQQAFEQHANETRQQHEALTARLEGLGGSSSPLRSFLAHLFTGAPKLAQEAAEEQDKTAENLVMAFAVENSEAAMYEALAVGAEAAGDRPTVELARRIQQQEQATADKIWTFIGPVAREAFSAELSLDHPAAEVLVRHLRQAEAAEQNSADALRNFSEQREAGAVQSLMAALSRKAGSRQERLQLRLEALGGTRSNNRSVFEYLLEFTPTSAQLGQAGGEKATQHLMIAYSAAAGWMAMYESLAAIAEAAGDRTTELLARELQREQSEDHQLAWKQVGQSALDSFHEVGTYQTGGGDDRL